MEKGDMKGDMTVREAGRRGGTKTSERYNHEFYEEIGKRGGDTTRRYYGREFYSEIGKKGAKMRWDAARVRVEQAPKQG